MEGFSRCCKTAAIVDITSAIGSTNTSPYVSFVAWGRNDAYTPAYRRRGTEYRIDRHDLRVDDPSIWDLDHDELVARIESLPTVRQEWIEQMAYWGLRELHTNACGDFTLLDASYWRLLRGHQRDETVLSFDIDSLVMHAAAAYGVKECRWPPSCKVFKPIHGRLNNSRI